jgi:hypothetical protein
MYYVVPILLILGGILAASSLIVAKKPEAKDLIAKLTPYQAIIGVALLGTGIWNLFLALTSWHLLAAMSVRPVYVIIAFVSIISAILLGLMFGMPMVGRLSASGAAKGAEMAKKLAPYQVLIGLVGMGCGVFWILFTLGIMPGTL